VVEVVAAHSVLVFEMADDRLDGRAVAHLALDRGGHATFFLFPDDQWWSDLQKDRP
jgi:hypothetical protein